MNKTNNFQWNNSHFNMKMTQIKHQITQSTMIQWNQTSFKDQQWIVMRIYYIQISFHITYIQETTQTRRSNIKINQFNYIHSTHLCFLLVMKLHEIHQYPNNHLQQIKQNVKISVDWKLLHDVNSKNRKFSSSPTSSKLKWWNCNLVSDFSSFRGI